MKMKRKYIIILIISIAVILVAAAIVSVILITNKSKEPGEEKPGKEADTGTQGDPQPITGCGVVSDDGKFVFSFPKYCYDKQWILTRSNMYVGCYNFVFSKEEITDYELLDVYGQNVDMIEFESGLYLVDGYEKRGEYGYLYDMAFSTFNTEEMNPYKRYSELIGKDIIIEGIIIRINGKEYNIKREVDAEFRNVILQEGEIQSAIIASISYDPDDPERGKNGFIMHSGEDLLLYEIGIYDYFNIKLKEVYKLDLITHENGMQSDVTLYLGMAEDIFPLQVKAGETYEVKYEISYKYDDPEKQPIRAWVDTYSVYEYDGKKYQSLAGTLFYHSTYDPEKLADDILGEDYR